MTCLIHLPALLIVGNFFLILIPNALPYTFPVVTRSGELQSMSPGLHDGVWPRKSRGSNPGLYCWLAMSPWRNFLNLSKLLFLWVQNEDLLLLSC